MWDGYKTMWLKMKKEFSRKIIVFILMVLGVLSYGQAGIKQVAILPLVDAKNDVNDGVKLLLRSKMTAAVLATSGYGACDRLDLSEILPEYEFQRTGFVDDDQIRQIGLMGGLSYLIIIEVANYDVANVVLSARIIDVSTVRLVNSSEEIVSISPDKMEQSCWSLITKLLNSLPETDNVKGALDSRVDIYKETAFGINMLMVYVDGGSFLMGCTSEQGYDCYDDEKNVHQVMLDGFYIGKFEVTQEQWEKVMGTSIYQQKRKAGEEYEWGIGADHPMYYVSWEEADAFCKKLSQWTGKKYRLPTEAQWEFAARGGIEQEGAKYSGSSSIDIVAWYAGNSDDSTHTVGTRRANLLGLHDMSGNVYEWCRDWYEENYSCAESHNPQGPSVGEDHVLRGGSWSEDARHCRVSNRYGDKPGYRDYDCGFRVVCEP